MTLGPGIPEIPDEAWRNTPAPVKVVIRFLLEWLDRLLRNSGNSSKPPSSDGPAGPARRRRPPTGKKQGGQPGHEGHARPLLPPEKVDHFVTVKPDRCAKCETRLHGDDPEPELHQVTELPPVEPETTEFQIHTLGCDRCGHRTKGELPPEVPRGALGPRVQATVGLLTGAYHLSDRVAQSAMADLFGVDISLGSIPACQDAVSAAVEAPVEEARAYAQAQPIGHADETGWREQRKRVWLWVLATPLVSVFLIQGSRGRDAAKALLDRFAGILVTDRWVSYDYWPFRRHQLCWAHLTRDFVKILERGGSSGRIGKRLLDEVDTMFSWWHRVRDGTMARSTFAQKMRPLQMRVEQLLATGAACRHSRTAGTCKEILEHATALWTFVRIPGVEPTNNFGEQVIRQAVMWRKISYGTQSAEGSRFVERMLTVAASLRQQHRNVVGFVTEAVQNKLLGKQAPSLLPTSQSRQASVAA